MASFTVFFDACVLYPAPLRDFLIHLSLVDLFRARWTDRIHDEWIRNLLVNRPDLKKEQLERTRKLMNLSVLDSLVTDYEDLIDGLKLPDQDDCHVLAAAIKSGSSAIITFNLKDFPETELTKYGIEALHPDDFISAQFDLGPGKVCVAAKRQRSSLKNPPKTVSEYLDILAKQRLPKTVSKLREYMDLI